MDEDADSPGKPATSVGSAAGDSPGTGNGVGPHTSFAAATEGADNASAAGMLCDPLYLLIIP